MENPVSKHLVSIRVAATLAATLFTALGAQAADPPKTACEQCATWNAPHKPFKIYGNTYYVGVHGLTSVLITSKQGHVLIDGALGESVPQIAASIQALGFRVEDVKLILNTHDHFDHAGGIAELQKLSGATVAALAPSAKVLEQGASGTDDPQYGQLLPISKVKSVRVLKDGETVRVGDLALTAHSTPGHTPGGTSWTWKSCESSRCLNMVYVDSLSPISFEGFKFSSNKTYPNALADFEKSFTTISSLPCDVLISPHPEVSNLFARIESGNGLIDATACKRYVEMFRGRLKKRLEEESASR